MCQPFLNSSSLLLRAEALCDVRLPRSDGTCTRCPMEVRMASAVSSHGGDSAPEPWSACVRVRRSHDRMGNLLAGIPVETVVRVSKVGMKAKAHIF